MNRDDDREPHPDADIGRDVATTSREGITRAGGSPGGGATGTSESGAGGSEGSAGGFLMSDPSGWPAANDPGRSGLTGTTVLPSDTEGGESAGTKG